MLAILLSFVTYTEKPVLSCHSKIDKTKVLKTGGSLMQAESIEECSMSNTFDMHYKPLLVLKTFFQPSFEWPLKTGFTVYLNALAGKHAWRDTECFELSSYNSLPISVIC